MSGTSSWDKFVLLLWKNWVIQSRHLVQTFFEIFIPVAFTALLILFRSIVDPEVVDQPTYYNPLEPYSIAEFHRKLEQQLGKATMEIAYAPTNPVLEQLIINSRDILYKTENYTKEIGVQGIATHEELYQTLVTFNIWVGVEFPEEYARITSLPEDFKFTLRFPSELRTSGGFIEWSNWFTNRQYPAFQLPGPRNSAEDSGGQPSGYYQEGFLPVQYAISRAYTQTMAEMAEISVEELPEMFLHRYPYKDYLDDPLLIGLEGFVPLIIVISFIYTSVNIVKYVTIEKEKQLKEAMKIMGLSNWLHWSAWFIKCYIFYFIVASLMVVIFKVEFKSDSEVAVFTNTDWTCLWVYLLIYNIASICFCFMISSFFSKANTASMLASLLWFMSFAPYGITAQTYDTMQESTKWGISFVSNSAMSLGMKLIMRHESTGYGLQWNNFFKPATQDDNFTVGHTAIMLLVDSVLYMIIALYVEKVMPGEFGLPEPWYFPFSPAYWCSSSKGNAVEDFDKSQRNTKNFEPDPKGIGAGIQIRNLKKTYSNKKTAVEGLTLNMYEDQITVLLGHNGAGKTTTMSMLTGLIPPTSGSALLDGKDIRTNMNGVRESLGLCPQHNVLFDELTVAEHIKFFSKLKGLRGKDVTNEIKKYTELLELTDKKNAQSKTLSGGMKRKLSVGIALAGNSKVVLLDEPTSGMDPSARRGLWELLIKEKKSRTVLLSTHFMDEADVLGDRIAIMADGDLKCVGSPFFLKKRYGVGYRLVCVKGPKCDANRMTNLLRKYIPDIKVETDIGTELSYVLNENYSSKFKTIFEDVEQNTEECGITSYGVSLTTMEEVFLKVGSDSTTLDEDRENLNANGTVDAYGNGFPIDRMENGEERLLTGFTLIQNQAGAMFLKKWFYTIRNWKAFLIVNLVPIIFLFITILTVRNDQSEVKPIPLEFKLNMLQETTTLFEKSTFPAGSREALIIEQYQNIFAWNDDHKLDPVGSEGIQKRVLNEYAENEPNTNKLFMVGASVTTENITAWFNNQAYHTVPLTVLMLQNAILKTFCKDCEISVTNSPLETSFETKLQGLQQGNNMGFQLAYNTGFSFAFVTSFFILFYIKERISRSKLLQFVSGVNIKIYWVVSFIWDYGSFILTIFLYIGVMAIFQEDNWKTFTELGRVLAIMMLFGWASLPIVYLASFLFSIPSTGFVRVSIMFILLGVILFMVVFIMEADVFDLKSVTNILDWVFIVFPPYSLARSLSNMDVLARTASFCQSTCDLIIGCDLDLLCRLPLPPGTPLSECCDIPEIFSFNGGGIAKNLVAFAVVGLICFTLLFMVEYRALDWIMYKSPVPKNIPETEDDEMDSDVRAEKDRIIGMTQMEISHHNLILRNMTKYYKKFRAVNQLCVGVEHGECFGLLGINGAGKTSTFKMLTGDEGITSGDAWVQGISLRTSMSRVNQMIGYCPQFDALLEDLTGREHLKIYCLLRGIPSSRVAQISAMMADELNFGKHMDKITKAYSGGNKRKLSTAIALLGNPSCIYLDEPTSGMDPGAKRQLWDVICKIRKQGKSIVLTSHSMEECEALCTRLAIMVNGEFKCLGSTQHLKNKFSEGFLLTMKLSRLDTTHDQSIQSIKDFVTAHFHGAVLKEEHSDLLTYHIRETNLKWSEMFGLMEDNKEALSIEDYSLGQTSLEQVFLFFTKYQREDDRQKN